MRPHGCLRRLAMSNVILFLLLAVCVILTKGHHISDQIIHHIVYMNGELIEQAASLLRAGHSVVVYCHANIIIMSQM